MTVKTLDGGQLFQQDPALGLESVEEGMLVGLKSIFESTRKVRCTSWEMTD